MAEKVPFIGIEMDGVGSAFDGPVYVQEIKWTERLTPMSWQDVEAKVQVGRQALGSSGRVAISGEHEGGMPLVDMSALRDAVVTQVDALARIALSSTTYESLEAALLFVSNSHPVRRGVERLRWVERNLDRLVPGAVLSVHDDVDVLSQRQSVIIGIEIPPVHKEYQFGKWKIHTIAPGESRAVTYTLASLINGARGAHIDGVAQTVLGTDLYEAGQGDRMRAVVQAQFDRAPSGLRERSASVLSGNMYLASEWASATKLGRGVIFTDDRKVRHRAIMLRPEFSREMVEHLPVRLWSSDMVNRYVTAALYGERAAAFGSKLRVDRTFGSAWAHAQGDAMHRNAVIQFDAATGIAVSGLEGVGMRRFAASLRTAQDKIRQAETGDVNARAADDPLHVAITSRLRKGVLTMEAKTPEKMERALSVLIAGAGLELFATRRSPEGLLAQEVVNDYFEERRARAERDLQNARAGRAMGHRLGDHVGGDARDRMVA